MNGHMHQPHPVRLVVEDDYYRNRLTVFLRLILAIPHLIWFFLWTVLIILTAVLNWLVSIFTGKPPDAFHRLMSAYVRYQAHLGSYLALVADPYPGFLGEPGSYPIDIELPEEPVAQRRWKILVRLPLAIPALFLSGALGGLGGGNLGGSRRGSRYSTGGGALLLVSAFLGWFASLVRGEMPKGLRDAGAYSLGYSAQVTAYLLLVTERYPNADPTEMLFAVTDRPPRHPVRVVGDPYDLRRSRLTVFFRLLLALPHLVWVTLWGIVAFLAAIVQWFVTLFRGTPAGALHRFISTYIRYRLHVIAFLMLVANPFPGFTGTPGMYPLDLELDGPQRQNRWKTGFRLVLAIPAFLVDSALSGALFTAAVLTWFYALVKGSAPWGLRNLSVYALRYDAQTSAYVYLVTDAYPHASPLEGQDPTEA
jgi:ABC-type amino acid transport system permease subunit